MTQPNIYSKLREQILTGKRVSFNISAASTDTEPWGVVMDWGVNNGTATVVAISDGSASIYLSGGGGYLGGQGHQAIRDAAKRVVEAAVQSMEHFQRTAEFPLPNMGQVTFYALTDAGVFTATARVQDLSQDQNPLTRLGNAMQAIITEYRRLQ